MDGSRGIQETKKNEVEKPRLVKPLTKNGAIRGSVGLDGYPKIMDILKTYVPQNSDIEKVKNIIPNYITILSHDPYLKGKFRFNAMTGNIALQNMYWHLNEHTLHDVDLFNIQDFISEVYEIENQARTKAAIEKVAFDNKFHPVQNYLSSLRWDGVNRIGNLFPRYLGADYSELTEAITRMLLYAAIQRVFHPGIKFDNCIILADKHQGGGKSTICRFLAVKDEWFTDSLNDMNDPKKAGELIRGKWICELGEMIATKKTKDIESIKSFLSRTVDSFREAYAIYANDFPRQTVFLGTTNKAGFLPEDPTGNRRFFPIMCHSGKAVIHPLANEAETRAYIDQCYAQAMVEGKAAGFPLELDIRFLDELNEIRAEAEQEDARIGMIQEWLDNTQNEFVCTRMIYDNVFDPDKRFPPSNFLLGDIAEIMNNKIDGWERHRSKSGNLSTHKFGTYYGTQKAWRKCKPQDKNGKPQDDSSEDFRDMNREEEEELPFI